MNLFMRDRFAMRVSEAERPVEPECRVDRFNSDTEVVDGEPPRSRMVFATRQGVERIDQLRDSLPCGGDGFQNLGFACARNQSQHLADFADRAFGSLVIRLVHHEHIGDLHHAGFNCLDVVTHSGHEHDGDDIRYARDFDFILTNTDRLDQDVIEAVDSQPFGRIASSVG
jgi:hypothetical protein